MIIDILRVGGNFRVYLERIGKVKVNWSRYLVVYYLYFKY